MRGYILNKFRGDPRLLAGGPERLEHLTGVPTVAVVPWVAERLPEEDAFGWRNDSATTGFRVAVVAYPSISNLDEFRSLEETATVELIRPSEWAEAVHQPPSRIPPWDEGNPKRLTSGVSRNLRLRSCRGCSNRGSPSRSERHYVAGVLTTIADVALVGKATLRPVPLSVVGDNLDPGHPLRPLVPVLARNRQP